MKELIRYLLQPIAELSGGSFYATPGTLKCRFLDWLYGNGEPVSDGWQYPEDDTQ